MGCYTTLCENKLYDIFPEDENYTDELKKIAAVFRTFGSALNTFLKEHGLEDDSADEDAKIAFLKSRFQAAHIPVPRSIRKWFENDFIIGKKTAFLICLAFHLSVEETDDFLRRTCFSRSFDYHSREDVIFWYGIKHQLSYERIQLILSNSDKTKQGRIHYSKDVKYTNGIRDDLAWISTEEELIAYLNGNQKQFAYNNVTATKFIKYLWNEIAKENGVAEKERRLFRISFDGTAIEESGEENQKKRKNHVDSRWMVYLQMLGLQGEPIYQMAKDRSVKFIFQDNQMISVMASRCFPDRDGMNKVLQGEHISEERMRKLMILFAFYHTLGKWAVDRNTYGIKGKDAEKCISIMNHYLMDASYPELYAGNPYDWIFLFSLNQDVPLQTFRESFMKELYFEKINHK